MFGPLGCSKTLMGHAIALEEGLNFLAMNSPYLLRKWVGESEKSIWSLFATNKSNRFLIFFFDEIDGLAIVQEYSKNVNITQPVFVKFYH